MAFAIPRWSIERLLPPLTIVVLVLALIFGGGSQHGLWSDVPVQLASLPLLVVATISNFRRLPERANVLVPLLLVGTLLLLPLLQLVPLPPYVWGGLPGRADIAQAYAAANVPLPWLPLSLNPTATWRSLVSLLPAVALFLATLSLEEKWQRLLILCVLAVAIIDIPLGLLQMMDGLDSQLRFYAITNPDRAVGFFGNANHNAAFLYCAVPFVVALAMVKIRQAPRSRAITLLAALLIFAIVIAIAATRSRAGAGLGLFAWALSMVLIWRFGTGTLRRTLIAFAVGTSLLAVLFAFQFGFVSLASRMQDPDIIGTFRWNILIVTWDAIAAYFPVGSGFGTFVPVYQFFEPRTFLFDKYVNHAHNDWLELCLEGGLLTLAALLGFGLWLINSIFGAWRNHRLQGKMEVAIFAQAGSIVIVLLMLHSIVDYPLRATSLMAVFAISCALLIEARSAKAPAGNESA